MVSDGYTSKCSRPYCSNLPFKIFLTFGHSGAQDWAPECPNVKKFEKVGWPSMALNALVDSFCRNQKKCGTERVKFPSLSWLCRCRNQQCCILTCTYNYVTRLPKPINSSLWYYSREKCHMHLVAAQTRYGKILIKYKGSQFGNKLPETLKSLHLYEWL